MGHNPVSHTLHHPNDVSQPDSYVTPNEAEEIFYTILNDDKKAA